MNVIIRRTLALFAEKYGEGVLGKTVVTSSGGAATGAKVWVTILIGTAATVNLSSFLIT